MVIVFLCLCLWNRIFRMPGGKQQHPWVMAHIGHVVQWDTPWHACGRETTRMGRGFWDFKGALSTIGFHRASYKNDFQCWDSGSKIGYSNRPMTHLFQGCPTGLEHLYEFNLLPLQWDSKWDTSTGVMPCLLISFQPFKRLLRLCMEGGGRTAFLYCYWTPSLKGWDPQGSAPLKVCKG